MTTFDERERAYEAKFAHDADMLFRAEARRNRLLGEWAADLLGKSGDEARSYAMSIVAADFKEAGEEDVYVKLAEDLAGKADEGTIRKKMVDLMIEAKAQMVKEAE